MRVARRSMPRQQTISMKYRRSRRVCTLCPSRPPLRTLHTGTAHAQQRLRMRRMAIVFLLVALPASGDVFRVLDDPRDAAQARVDMIEQAHHEIDAAYFLARNDRITLSILRLLRDARRRGVEHVRL